jgi:acetoin utilization deacetylase AcuC-like enzyme
VKVVYHPRYTEVYTHDPAAAPGRMESIYKELAGHFEFIEPPPADIEDIKLVHSEAHIESIKRMGLTYDISLLAAGGAIKAAQMTVSGESVFAVIRPPGHHASRDHCWGFCYFNNMAMSIAKLRAEGKIKTALIIDIDLHFGDGTSNIFKGIDEVVYFHPEAANREQYISRVSQFLSQHRADIIAISAGFDRHEEDWGGLLKTEDYKTIGTLVKKSAERVCNGRRYGVLEGGYKHRVLGKNVKHLLDGLA